ncbi:MAG: plasmid replication protein, CyRepA1 family, partial [Cyanobacteria bacterium J06559_3]
MEDPHYWPWVERHNLPIAITEGEKKAGFLLSQGISAIALPGVHNAIRTRDADGCKLFEPYLVPDLKRFATKDREITVCFDHETRVKQRRALDSEIEKIKQHFGYEKAKTRVLELPGPEKGVDDFGVAHGADAFVELYDAAPNFELWTVQRYSRLSYPVAQSLNQRYLGDLNIPKTANLIALKSPKGTGKTESFKHLVEQATDQGQRTLLITHRVQLGQAICDRVALPYVTELRTTAEGDLLGYGVCVDSLHPNSQARFNAEDWKDALIIIDECEQVIWHLLEGRTEIRQHRLEVLNQLQVLFDGVLNSDRGRIVLSDADLSDQSIRFIGDLVDRQTEVQPYVVVNSWQPSEPWQVYNYTQSKPEQWGAAMLRALDEGQRIMICTQSQKTKSRWSTTTLEALIAKRYPGRKVLRIDSQSVSDPQHPAYLCTAHLNEILPNYDVVICSPTIETGVSIDIRGHFHSLWACGQGVLSENSTRQFLARLRDPVPRHIWCQSFGVGRIANGATSIKGLLACQYKLAKQNANLLRYAAFGEDMLKSFSGTLYIWAVMGCRINSGAIHYRQAVMAALRREGHHIHTVEVVGCSMTKVLRMPTADGDHQYLDTELEVLDLKEELDEIKTVNHKAECEAIAGAEEITPKQYERLKAQKAKTQQQWHTERKHEVGDRYQVEVTPDLVSKDSDGWYPKLKLFYYLTIGRPYLKQRDQGNFESEVKSGGAWLPTLNGSQMGLKVHLLRHLGVQQLRSPELLLHGGNRASDGEIEAGSRQHYDNCHPLLWKITQKARRYAWEVKAILGVTISEKMSPIQIVQSLLRKLDLKLEFVHQEGGRGDRQRY